MNPSLARRSLAAVTTFATLSSLAIVVLPGSEPAKPQTAAQQQAAVVREYGKLPLAFEANGGRTDKRVDFIARGAGYALFLTPGENVLNLRAGKKAAVVRTQLVGAQRPRGIAEGRLPGSINSLIGRDRTKWRTGIRSYRKVRYPSVYPGTDVLYYGRHGRVEYDFILQPGADPGRIAFDVRGARNLRVAKSGDLVMTTDVGTVRHLRPVAYQPIAGQRRAVDAHYVIDGRRVRIAVGAYDRGATLVIDPVLAYSTFLGGTSSDVARAIAVGTDGSAYITGETSSSDFPLAGAYDSTRASTDGFVTKLNPSGTAVTYSTFFGGSSLDYPRGIAASSSGLAYIVGETYSSDFPTAASGADTTRGGSTDAFVMRINSSGSGLSWSTYLGGASNDEANDVAVDTNGAAHVVGNTSSSDFPTSTYRYQTNQVGQDAFYTRVAYSTDPFCFSKICPTSLSRSYSTYLGGSASDQANGVAVDSSGNAYVAGSTDSELDTTPDPDLLAFPTKSASGGDTNSTDYDAFLAKLDPTPSGATDAAKQEGSLVYSTYLSGTREDYALGVDVDPGGTAYVVGYTDSSGLPSRDATAPFTHVPAAQGDFDGFLITAESDTATPPALTLSSIYIGGDGPSDRATGITVRKNSLNYVSQYVTGQTDSGSGFPIQKQLTGSTMSLGNLQLFALKRSTYGTPPALWSITVGGQNSTDFGKAIAVDSAGRAYVAGYSAGQNEWPTTTGAFQTGLKGSNDAIVARIDQLPPTIDPDADPSTGPRHPADGAVIGDSDVEFSFHWNESNLKQFKCNPITSGRIVTGTRSTCTTPKTYTGLAEGKHVFEVVSVDEAYDESDPAGARITFYVDRTAPPVFDLTEPANGSQTDTQPTFKWQQSDDLGTAVTYELFLDGNKVKEIPESDCVDGICSTTLDPLVTGPHEWSVRATDEGNFTRDSTSKFTFTAITPPVPKMSISPNPALVGRDVTFDGTGSSDASHTIAKYEWDLDGDGSFETDAGDQVITKKAYAAAATIPISLRVTDTSGSQATTSGELKITSVATAGLLGVTINNGAQYTKSPDVIVSSVFPSTTTQMVFSNDGGFLAPTAFTPQKDTNWKLDSSGPERLPKTIYVRFFNGPFPGETFQDDIILDETPPKVNSAAVSPVAGASSAVATVSKARLKKWKAKLKATDSNSGVQYVQLTSNKKKPGKLLKYKKKLTVKSAKRPRWVRARDKAGNYSKWRKAR